MILEICANGLQSAFNAGEGGADRVELCAALEIGGLTPSLGLIELGVKRLNIPVHILIRPRSGNFVYSEPEKELMLRDIIFSKESGAAGIVIGALNASNGPDIPFLKKCISAAGKMEKTFHRAIDVMERSDANINQLIELGFKRILTSGGADSVSEGLDELARLCDVYGDKIEIMAGSGVNLDNINTLMSIKGLSAIHSSAKGTNEQESSGIFPEGPITDPEMVKRLRNATMAFS